MTDQRETLSMRKTHRSKRPHQNKRPPQGNHEKASLSHEVVLKRLLRKPIEMRQMSQDGKIEGILVGYDAFTLTVEVQGVTTTYFKHGLESFSGVEELH